MSKNFELMQQAGMARDMAPAPRPIAAFPVGTGNGHHNGNGHRNGADLNLDELARDESMKLVQRIFFLQAGEPAHAVVFAGIDHGNGCSRICAQTAKILASNVQGTVCLVDSNLRSPSLPQFFGITNHRGLTDALMQEGPIKGFAKQLQPENLWLLSCGSLAADSPNLLNSDRLNARITELRKEFNYVLIDASPLNVYGDAMALGKLTDGVVLVLEANSTRRDAAVQVTEALRTSQVHVLGAVLNKRTFPIPESLYQKL
jgi:succinoglycan biosynthesis transport protein ExoP